MIIGKKFIFIHNPRTGGAFVRNALKDLFPQSDFLKLEDWHKPISKIKKEDLNKLKFGTVRNPWAWYVSWYHHQQPGGLWLKLFLNGKKNTFENFLRNVLSRKFCQEHLGLKFYPVGNPYLKPSVPVIDYMYNLNVGFVTYRYIYMFCKEYEKIFAKKKDIFKEHNKLFSLDEVLRCETLVNSLLSTFKNNNIQISKINENKLKRLPVRNNTNHRNYREYYTKDLIQLVKKRDRLIINQYGYKF